VNRHLDDRKLHSIRSWRSCACTCRIVMFLVVSVDKWSLSGVTQLCKHDGFSAFCLLCNTRPTHHALYVLIVDKWRAFCLLCNTRLTHKAMCVLIVNKWRDVRVIVGSDNENNCSEFIADVYVKFTCCMDNLLPCYCIVILCICVRICRHASSTSIFLNME